MRCCWDCGWFWGGCGGGLDVPLAGVSSLRWLWSGGDLPLACPRRQVRDLYLVGTVEVDHKTKRDNQLNTGRSSWSCPGPPVPPGSPCRSGSALIFLPILLSSSPGRWPAGCHAPPSSSCIPVPVAPLVSVPSTHGPVGTQPPSCLLGRG